MSGLPIENYKIVVPLSPTEKGLMLFDAIRFLLYEKFSTLFQQAILGLIKDKEIANGHMDDSAFFRSTNSLTSLQSLEDYKGGTEVEYSLVLVVYSEVTSYEAENVARKIVTDLANLSLHDHITVGNITITRRNYI